MEQEIAFSKEHPDWVMPSANFYHDWTFANVTLRGIFFDTSPFVTKYYQEPTKTYFAKYLEEHVRSQPPPLLPYGSLTSFADVIR